MASISRNTYNASSSHRRDIEMSDDSDESEDEETRLQREEDEQERLLSRQHGEAAEAPSSKRGPQTAEEIEAEYEKNKNSVKRIKRPTLTVDMMTGVNGLVRIPVEFKHISFRNEKSIASAAAYSLKLMESYKKFCFDLMPSMAFEDVVLKIEKEGGSKQLKDYLQNMRNAQRDEYLEGLYGKEKAEQFLADLQGLYAEQHAAADDDEFGASAEYDPSMSNSGLDVSGNGMSANADMSPSPTATATVNVARQVSSPSNRTDIQEDDEEEFEFDDDEVALKGGTLAGDDKELADGATTLPANKKRRFVLEDSSDEEEEGGDDLAAQCTNANAAVALNVDVTDKNEDSPDQLNMNDGISDVHGAIELAEASTEQAKPANKLLPTSDTRSSPVQQSLASATSRPAYDDTSSPSTSVVEHRSDLAQTQQTQSQTMATTQSDETATILGSALTALSSEDEGNYAAADGEEKDDNSSP
ncbi:hypothetical protein MPSEU_000725700 [Mayamaea pseudoterrestris]|nr:hypothetical protein MPSEU_000725700 [Mayamaea pseudoterrestris]